MDLPHVAYPDVGVDLETTSVDPEHGAILQIAAVRFNYQTGAIGPAFDRCLWMPGNRYWSESTREFWARFPETLEGIQARSEDPRLVMESFRDWLIDTGPAMVPQRLWAKPSHFEYPFLQSYSRQFEVELPFHYRNVVDLNSYTRGLADDPGANPIEWDVEFEGEVHNAIDDVLHQIRVTLLAKHLIAAKKAAA